MDAILFQVAHVSLSLSMVHFSFLLSVWPGCRTSLADRPACFTPSCMAASYVTTECHTLPAPRADGGSLASGASFAIPKVRLCFSAWVPLFRHFSCQLLRLQCNPCSAFCVSDCSGKPTAA